MTVAPPSYTPHTTLSSGSYQKTQHAAITRRGSLQENSWMNGTGCIVPRRSSLSSITKTKSLSSPSLVVVVDKVADDNVHGSQHVITPSANSDSSLQSADKRRRYQRRGSKTSFMMKVSCKMDLPLEWQTPLAKAIKSVRLVNSSCSSSTLDDSSMHSQGTMSATASLFTQDSRSSSEEMFSAQANRRHSTISLLTSALELSCIEGQGIGIQQD